MTHARDRAFNDALLATNRATPDAPSDTLDAEAVLKFVAGARARGCAGARVHAPSAEERVLMFVAVPRRVPPQAKKS